MTVAAGVVPDSEVAEASPGGVLAAALDANRELARPTAELREENERLRAENAEQDERRDHPVVSDYRYIGTDHGGRYQLGRV